MVMVSYVIYVQRCHVLLQPVVAALDSHTVANAHLVEVQKLYYSAKHVNCISVSRLGIPHVTHVTLLLISKNK